MFKISEKEINKFWPTGTKEEYEKEKLEKLAKNIVEDLKTETNEKIDVNMLKDLLKEHLEMETVDANTDLFKLIYKLINE